MIKQSRRDFLRQSAKVTGLLGTASFINPSLLMANTTQTEEFEDYKAIVVLMLQGGNDSLNMLIPTSESGENGFNYDNYSTARGINETRYQDILVNNNPLDIQQYYSGDQLTTNPYASATVGTGTNIGAYRFGHFPLNHKGIPAGINSVMPELAKLIEDDKCSIIANVGTLVKPIDKSLYQDSPNDRPPFLFSHNNQRRMIQTGKGDDLYLMGWGGRIVDKWSYEQTVNGNSIINMSISYGGNNRLLMGNDSSGLVLPTGKMIVHKHANQDNDSSRYGFGDAFQALNNQNEGDIFTRLFRRMNSNAYNKLYAISDTLDNAGDLFTGVTDAYGNALFSSPDNEGKATELPGGSDDKLIKQMESLAKMITLSAKSSAEGGFGAKRQIFYIQMGGFDTHSGQANKHASLLRGLSMGLDKFQRAMESQGLADNVTLMSSSDFGRTVRSNGDGTDHAWGSQQFVMGGALNNNRMVGQLPDLALGSNDDVSSKGRILPTTAYDQVCASVCKWWGVNDSDMQEIFPNLLNFSQNGNIASSYLDLFDS